jgi:soluble lytic murein transglycosylase
MDWAQPARQSAIKLQPEGGRPVPAAERIHRKHKDSSCPDDLLAWKVRAALRADGGKARWQQVMQAIDAMSPAEQKDPAWIYWKARALQALAKDSQDGEALKTSSRELLTGIAAHSTSTASSPPRTWASRRRCRRSRAADAAEREASPAIPASPAAWR